MKTQMKQARDIVVGDEVYSPIDPIWCGHVLAVTHQADNFSGKTLVLMDLDTGHRFTSTTKMSVQVRDP